MSGFRSALAIPFFRLSSTPAVFVPPPALSDVGYLSMGAPEGYAVRPSKLGYSVSSEKAGFLSRVTEWFEVLK